MLGKTNVTTVKGGTIVSDIADYGWDNISPGGIAGNFVKAIYGNDFLVAITSAGEIAYTKDGENWEVQKLTLEDNYELNDLAWDGERFVFVGSHTDNDTYISGLVVMSDNLVDFEVKTDVNKEDYFGLSTRYMSFIGVMAKDGQYSVVYVYLTTTNAATKYYLFAADTDFKSYASHSQLEYYDTGYSGSSAEQHRVFFNGMTSKACKRDGKIIIYVKYLGYYNHASYIQEPNIAQHDILAASNGTVFSPVLSVAGSRNIVDIFSVFECKGSFYYIAARAEDNYKLVKLSGSFEKLIMATDVDFGFIDAVYFNKCEIFVNAHQMLVVRPGENIAGKSFDDLVEITYDFSLTSILKAFNKLYVFGTGGNILVSNDEVKNEGALAVKTMSASKALYDAKAYTDEKCMELETRIAVLETAGVQENGK